jgi:hypothetical protein
MPDIRHRLLILVALLAQTACGDASTGASLDADVPEVTQDVVFDVPRLDTGDDVADIADAAPVGPVLCETPGGFGCTCTSNADCLDELCVEGRDGNLCTRTCVTECPADFDCLTTSLGGSDPISVCVPRHARLCRPCVANTDCQSPLEQAPSLCIPGAAPEDGSFCATSCAQAPCPSGYRCDNVVAGETSAMLCVPEAGECQCRESWQPLGLVTTCAVTNSAGTCSGTRTCGPNGLTACSAQTPLDEVCNLEDEDCDGLTDDIAEISCENSNEFGTCAGVSRCNDAGDQECSAHIPTPEYCNDFDDDCDGATDESWTDCLPAGCNEADGLYIETGEPACTSGDCVYASPRPCGLYTCDGGGDAGDTCASRCTDDSTCVTEAHCDELTESCVLDAPDGVACGDASDCASGHCQNGYCCASGDCCRQPDDCPAGFRQAPTCGVTADCQGTRRDARCIDAMCGTSAPIEDDSACSASTLARDCAPNVPTFCTGAATQSAPLCESGCDADADCLDGYHCDGRCVPNVTDGGQCDEDTDCAGGHCQNGFCCASGDCCSAAADCPAAYRDPPTCLDTVTCQGERIDAVCNSRNQCDSQTAQDDSGCDINTEANACGPYRSAYCRGTIQQAPPQCPFACAADSECDSGFHCDVVCVPNMPTGGFCDEDSDCGSGHCTNNVCCVGGDCCNRASDCPSSYFGAPKCDFPSTCQGTRDAAVCTNFVCGKVSGSADDSACAANIVANTCGAYPSVSCNGGTDQLQPQCATTCDTNAQCDTNAFCDNRTCKPKKVDGEACAENAQCAGGHCQNGFCCATGDCCQSAANCSPAIYGTPSTCGSPSTCQGTRVDPVCTANMCKLGTVATPDDTACSGEANNCGYYDAVFCTGAANQVAPSCPTSCAGSSACDDGANCTGSVCVPNQGAGGACTTSAQCTSGLTCVDGVCCNSTCTGTCKACNIGGNLGVCQNLASGGDPANECGAVSCTGYYFGFDAKTCYQRADVSGQSATCDGDGTCQNATDVCPTSTKGTATVTCHATCQTPTANTCTGTTPGQCTNVSGGTQTCGVGACMRTVDKCQNGDLAACVPGQPTAEVCDGIDNDCDGFTDAADPNMVLAPCDNQKGVCSGATKPASLCVAGVWQPCTNAIYSAWSATYQAGTETSCETTTLSRGLDNDCDGQVDEDFSYTAPDGTTVQGANKGCGTGVCSSGTTVCVNNALTCTTAGLAVAEVCDGADNDCDGKTDSLDGSLVKVACENQKGVCQGSMKPSSLCASGAWQPCAANQYATFSVAYQASETLCDGLDNDCSGATDNGLVAPNNANQLGACAGSKKSCGGVSGWTDNYSAVPTYNQSETPDGNFGDENCDGIDGDERLGLFVTTNGSAASSCTKAAPCTLARAISLASIQKPHIYLGAGSHLNGPFVIAKSLKIFGGFNASWVRKARSTVGHESRIYGGSYGTEGNAITLHLSGATTIDLADLYVHGVNAVGDYNGPGRSSYAVYATGVTLNIDRCDIIAGNGGAAKAGNSGTSASGVAAFSGGRGSNAYTGTWGGCDTAGVTGGSAGTNASCDVTWGNPTGGAGGGGGAPDTSSSGCGIFNGCCFDPRNGGSGANASAAAGAFGLGGAAGGSCGSGGSGAAGSSSDGTGGGGAAASRGLLTGGFWWGVAGNAGSLGRNGVGGGGGGGTGGCENGVDQADTSGAGGGGGGAGGCRASAAGIGGFAGGGSFGIFSSSTTLAVRQSTLTRGTGGNGGAGGAGGTGQPGGGAGSGGSGNTGSKAGASGGAGGRGGHSGAGGGGAGGVSFGIFRFAGSLSETGNTYLGGAGGAGGGGGTGSTAIQNGSAGTAGTSANTGTCTAAGGC